MSKCAVPIKKQLQNLILLIIPNEQPFSGKMSQRKRVIFTLTCQDDSTMSIIMIFIIVHKDINIFISHCVHPWSYLPVTLILSDTV